MNNSSGVSSSKRKSKIQSSLVLKLNAGMIWRLISSFIAINILIIIFALFLIFWKVEEGASIILNSSLISASNGTQVELNIDNYEIYKLDNLSEMEGFMLPNSVESAFPIKIEDSKRNIDIVKSKKNMKFLEKLDLLKYSIGTSLNGSSYEIIYSLGAELSLFLSLFSIVLLSELLIIIFNLKKGAKRIRRILKPLSDLAETARILNQEVSSPGSKSESLYIDDLAGVISSIDVNKLDSRISIDSSQNELKALTSAINDMLNRINDAYASQVRFVSDASHELRTPIAVIHGYANLLDRWGKEDPETMQESIDAIKQEAESMKELVNQLLFLARGDNETIQFHKEYLDICEIMDEVIKETEMIDSSHKFDLCLEGPTYVNVDKQLIKQVIRILVDNSIKYTPSGGQIILKIENKDNFAHITVQDSGIGIAPEDLASTFDRFYRSDESRARETGGSGLGLSIAKWIIEHHDGHFEITSRVDIGTRITIIIPEAESREEALI